MAFPSATLPGATATIQGPVGGPATPWYQFFQAIFQRTGGNAGIDGAALQAEADDTAAYLLLTASPPRNAAPLPLALTPGTSPYAYQAPWDGTVIVNGGTVSEIQYSRDHSTQFTMPTGVVPVNQGDLVTVTYSAAPTMTMVAR